MRPLKERDAAVLAYLKRDKNLSKEQISKIILTLDKRAQKIAKEMFDDKNQY